jgi:molybdopterin/thiamine biosynthesis adenylyltransferase
MAHIFQVGAGSGGMPVLDLLCREPLVTCVTLVEPDVYQPHNVVRHLFPASAVGRLKAELAADWLRAFRPDLEVRLLPYDLLDAAHQEEFQAAAAAADLGVCAADNEPAKYHFDYLMRQAGKPWTLGEVLSGGIGGFVHWFVPGGPCYGCVASYLQREVVVEQPRAIDYSHPAGAVAETTIPASRAAIQTIASLHALITRELLYAPAGYHPGFTTLLWSLQRVPGIFEEAFRPYRFRIPRLPQCLICQAGTEGAASSAEARHVDLDQALEQALTRLADD